MSKQRKCLTIGDKWKIIKEVDEGGRKKDVALRHRIPPSSLSTIMKNREDIKTNYEKTNRSERKRLKQCVYSDVDDATIKWITEVRDKNLPVSGAAIKQKALEFAKASGCDEFVASQGWLDKFKSRHGLTKPKVICVLFNFVL